MVTSVQLYRNGQRGVVHVTTGDPRRGYVRGLCKRSLLVTGRVQLWQGRHAVAYWTDDECNRCDECSARVIPNGGRTRATK